jgi:hypothetical protein
MAKAKITLNLNQFAVNDLTCAEDVIEGYTVVKATNTTIPKVNEFVSESYVKTLIREGVTVNITKSN